MLRRMRAFAAAAAVDVTASAGRSLLRRHLCARASSFLAPAAAAAAAAWSPRALLPGFFVPPIGYGSSDGGGTFTQAARGENLSRAVSRGARLLLLDGDGAAAAGAAAGGWWAAAALARSGAPRAELCIAGGFSAAEPASLRERAAAGAAAAGLAGGWDVLLLQTAGADGAAAAAALPALLDAAEAAIAAGAARGYALHARDWHALERGAAAGGGSSLQWVLSQLDAAARRAGAPRSRCVAISAPASLLAPGPLLRAGADGDAGGASVVELAERAGLAMLLTAPLDCPLPARELDTAVLRAEAAAAGAAAAAAPLLGEPPQSAAGAVRPFRCIDAPLHADSHPSRLAALLNDIINFAIHCELLWDRRVRALVEAARAGGGAQTPLPPPPPLQETDVAWAQLVVSRLNHPGFFTLMEWAHVKHHRLQPALARLAAATQGVDAAREWATCYRALMAELVAKVDVIVEQRHAHAAHALGGELLAAMGGAAPAPASDAAAAAAGWGRAAAPPLQSLVAALLLAFPNTLLLSEVPELHALATRSSARVRVEEAAGRRSGGGGAPLAAPLPGEDAPPPPPPAVAPEAARRVLRDVAARGRVLAAAAAPLPHWDDPLSGTPTQAELAPLQEKMRRLREAVAALPA